MEEKREYIRFILEQLSDIDDITYMPIMNVYMIYYHNKIIGYVFNDKLLVKPVDSAKKLIPVQYYEVPYIGAKAMLRVENVDDREFLIDLFKSIYNELIVEEKAKVSYNYKLQSKL